MLLNDRPRTRVGYSAPSLLMKNSMTEGRKVKLIAASEISIRRNVETQEHVGM